jgi:hypothetical protein
VRQAGKNDLENQKQLEKQQGMLFELPGHEKARMARRRRSSNLAHFADRWADVFWCASSFKSDSFTPSEKL